MGTFSTPDRLMGAALKLFAEHGYKATTVGAIESEAGLALGGTSPHSITGPNSPALFDARPTCSQNACAPSCITGSSKGRTPRLCRGLAPDSKKRGSSRPILTHWR